MDQDPIVRLINNRMDDLRDDVAELKSDLKSHVVTRNEWSIKNEELEKRMRHYREDFYHLNKRFNESRAPWWTYITVMVSIGALLWSVFGPVV